LVWQVPLLVCAVVVGNMFPIIERPHRPDGSADPNGYLGKAIVGKADTHVVVVAKDASSNDGSDDPLPCLPSRWGQVETFTEIVLQDDSQIQPLGYVMVRP
jgi:hypothetical protein